MNHERNARMARIVWLLAVIVLLTPTAGAWAVKEYALLSGCTTGPLPCTPFPLGAWFETSLDAAWFITIIGAIPLAVAIGAAAIVSGSVWRAVIGVGIVPFAALLLAVIAALSTTSFPGCSVNEGGVKGCLLWGADLNGTFAVATVAPWLLIVWPFVAALATLGCAIGARAVRRKYAAPAVQA
ncbi:MAG TPA: hypothetical protein VH000_07045 [Rhizomicrobium sp.]|nr:hypothetical protein [Rhizomicrobium sp.]